MTTPTFPTSFAPWQQSVTVGIESEPGTDATTPLYREECRTISPTENLTTEEEKGYVDAAADTFQSVLYQQAGAGNFSLPFRCSGIGALGLLTICGAGSETVTGASAPYTHTGVPLANSTRCDTWTAWLNTGDGAHTLKFGYATISQVDLTSAPTGAVVAAIDYTSKRGVPVAAPTPTVYVGSTANYPKTTLPGNKLAATIYNSLGVAITTEVTNMKMTISRPIQTVPNMNGLDPQDIVPGVLAVTGSFDFVYDGIGAGTLYSDYLAHNQLGDSTHVHQLAWTDADSNTCTIKLYPLYLSDVTLAENQTYITGTATFMATNDMAAVNTATPALTVIQSVKVTNAIATAMTL